MATLPLPEPLSRLTEKQIDCLRLVRRDRTSKDIGRALGISHYTVDQRLKAAIRALGVATRFEAAQLLAAHEEAGPTHQRLVYQPPDIAAASDPGLIGGPAGRNEGWRETGRQPMAREDLAAFTLDLPHLASAPPAPAPVWRRRRNDLSLGQRMLFLALAPIVVLLFGIGLAGAGGSILRMISGFF